MGLRDKIKNEKAVLQEEKTQPENNLFNELGVINFHDPRPDLKEDSFLWLQVFVEAHSISPDLYGRLHGMRCVGTLIVPGTNTPWVIRPKIDPTGNYGWKSQQDYEKERDRWLRPYTAEIKEILGKLIQWK